MASELSPQTEQFIQQAVASGLYPSREAMIDKAIEILHKAEARQALIHDVNQGIAEFAAGLGAEMTREDWDEIELAGIELARQDRAKAGG